MQAGKRLIGCWASLSNSLSTELLGYAGFDWSLLDGEHAPNDYGLLRSAAVGLAQRFKGAAER